MFHHSYTAIAEKVGCNHTTVARELRRNGKVGKYVAQSAQERYQKRREKCRPHRKLADVALREYVEQKIAVDKWSPELVGGCLPAAFPGRPKCRVCHETIYNSIYKNFRNLDHLIPYLTQGRPKRRPKGQGKTRRGPSILNRVSISERPEIVEARTEIGHWEGDRIVGKGNDAFILTLVERTSRRSCAVKTQSKRASEVADAVIAALLEYPQPWIKTITFDNGTEFAEHEKMTQELGTPVYFAGPYSSYQRGSNEQVNGLIRRVLPKGTPFGHPTQTKLDGIVENLNYRPRKCLGYRSPNEIFEQQRENHRRALET